MADLRHTRTTLPEGVTRVRNAVTGEVIGRRELDCTPAIVAAMRNRCRPGERVQYGWQAGEYVITRGIGGEVVELVAIKPKGDEA